MTPGPQPPTAAPQPDPTGLVPLKPVVPASSAVSRVTVARCRPVRRVSSVTVSHSFPGSKVSTRRTARERADSLNWVRAIPLPGDGRPVHQLGSIEEIGPAIHVAAGKGCTVSHCEPENARHPGASRPCSMTSNRKWKPRASEFTRATSIRRSTSCSTTSRRGSGT